jgi:hypothetical protein
MSDDSAIIQATTISELMEALNQARSLNLPTVETIPAYSPFIIWWRDIPVMVKANNGESTTYTATGTLNFFPFNFSSKLTAKVVVRVSL